MGNREYRIQLKDRWTQQNVITAGGKVFVAQVGTPLKQTLYDKDGAALSNPITPTRGFINFFVVDTAASVDLHGMAPGGQWFDALAVVPSGPNEIVIDTAQKRHVAKIPYSYVDQTGDATETDTGFDVPDPARVLDRLHGCGLLVVAIDATETIDVGILSSESGGDADGLIAAHTVGTIGLATGTNGALFSSNAPHKSDAVTGKSISYTLTTGADTAKGFILLPYDIV